MSKKNRQEQVIKMQKLRHAVTRLRNFRSTVPADANRQSWFERLKERLGVTK